MDIEVNLLCLKRHLGIIMDEKKQLDIVVETLRKYEVDMNSCLSCDIFLKQNVRDVLDCCEHFKDEIERKSDCLTKIYADFSDWKKETDICFSEIQQITKRLIN